MNNHTRKHLDDAENRKFDFRLGDLSNSDININETDDEEKIVLHYASICNQDAIPITILQNSNVNT